MIGDRQTMACQQSDFYRDSYYKLLRALLGLIGIILLLVAVLGYLLLVRGQHHYYITTTTGQVIPLEPMT